MTRVRLLAGAASALIGISIGLGFGGPAPSASAAVHAKPYPAQHRTSHHRTSHHRTSQHRMPREGRRPVVLNCTGAPAVRPRNFDLSCGDGADALARLHWRSWRANRAVARGIQEVNSCAPDCAHGRYARYAVTVILSGSARVAGHPRDRRYTLITLRYLGKRPSGVGPVVSGDLWP